MIFMNAARADMRSLPLLRRCSQFCVIPYSSFLRVKLPTSVIATLCLTAPAYERTLLSQVPFASAGLCKVRAPLLLWIVYMLALGSTAIQKTRSQATHRSFVSMAFSPIRVGVIGAGGNTKKLHIPNLQKIEGVQVVSVANRSLESSKKAADEHNIPKTAASWSEIINDPEVDAIVIGTWPYLHHTLVLAALAADKHVLTEARLAMNAKEAREMLLASMQKPNLVAQVVPSPITFKWDATIQQTLKEQQLGDLLYVEVRCQSGAVPQAAGTTMTWRQDIQLSGLNVMTLGIFYEALQRWTGDAVKVQAQAQAVVKTRTNGDTGEPAHVMIPDHLDILAELACGAQAHMVFSDVTGVGRSPSKEFWLYGSKGSLHLDLDAKKLSIALQDKGGKLEEVQIAEGNAGSWRVEEEFIGAIRGTEKVQRTKFATGVRYMEFTQAVAISYQTGQSVRLPLTSPHV